MHARNYSDLPLFDRLFGTFNSPVGFVSQGGFYDSASARNVDTLRAGDVSKSSAPAGRVQVA